MRGIIFLWRVMAAMLTNTPGLRLSLVGMSIMDASPSPGITELLEGKIEAGLLHSVTACGLAWVVGSACLLILASRDKKLSP